MWQGLSELLQFKWDLHIPWRPQSSGKEKWMNQTTRRNFKTVSRNPHEGGRCISYCFNKHLNHPMSLAGVRLFEILNDRLCLIDTVLMKGDQMHGKDGDVLRSYLLPFLWALSSLYRYLNLQPVAGTSLCVNMER